jgi:5-formyltetrahydrofolate cyclo-ligase
VGWQVQKLVGEIPRDSWDVPLDGFASPEGWRCSGEG